ncbi:MAG TPA: isoprenylcysteine carboxylmethyltransferase family protein [Polyangia bacterium]|nr:isoprenylcysteine carboxylmethyltransferase family protein [Polyangia bacterium]
MARSEVAFLALLAAVGLGRLVEMRLSRRHQRALAAQGARREPEPGFAAMVALHTGVLVASAVEVVALRRPFLPAVAVPALIAFALANALRWWVIATLGTHWNVQVVGSLSLGVVTGGPYRFVRHPNYVAVFVELLALPLVHGAWLTAVAGAALHVPVLRRRLALEEAVLGADATYRAAMSGKPRFVPRLRARGSAWPTS